MAIRSNESMLVGYYGDDGLLYFAGRVPWLRAVPGDELANWLS
jgi:hypothetical protein